MRLLFTPVQMTWAKVELLCRLSMATLEREFHVALLVRLCSGFRSCSDEENLFQDCRSFCLLNGLLLLYEYITVTPCPLESSQYNSYKFSLPLPRSALTP